MARRKPVAKKRGQARPGRTRGRAGAGRGRGMGAARGQGRGKGLAAMATGSFGGRRPFTGLSVGLEGSAPPSFGRDTTGRAGSETSISPQSRIFGGHRDPYDFGIQEFGQRFGPKPVRR